MEDDGKTVPRWERRDAKQRAKRRFASDNRKSVRWLYWNSGQKAHKEVHKEHSNEDTPSDML